MTVEELLARLEPIIVAKSKLATIPGMDWEDIAQELRILVWQKHEQFTNGKTKPETYANVLFRNKIINLYKYMTNQTMNRNYVLPDTMDHHPETNYSKSWHVEDDRPDVSWLRYYRSMVQQEQTAVENHND